ncbi:hypothetical protein CPC08DRAFT_612342, partial [Agrocybe pediades]
HLHVKMEVGQLEEWIKAYQTSPSFQRIWHDDKTLLHSVAPGYRFFKDEQGLLYFQDADYQPRLCVPEA